MKHSLDDPLILEEYLSRIDKLSEDECWEWTGGTYRGGYGMYGRFYYKGKRILPAHRISYLIYKGTIPEGKKILHSCDNPPCCNPKHLSAGTQLENVTQMWSRGRGKSTVGADQWGTSLSDEGAMRIYNHPMDDKNYKWHEYARIGTLYGVSDQVVARIKDKKTWRHIHGKKSD